MKTILKTMVLVFISMTIFSCHNDDNIPETDKIKTTLTTSKNAYINATNGTWVQITEPEYNALAFRVNNVTKSGTTDAEYNINTEIKTYDDPFTGVNRNDVTMPKGSYLFAFKYHAGSDNMNTTKVKQSSITIEEGYIDIGTTLPTHNEGGNYFVLKGSNTRTTSTGFLAIHARVEAFRVLETWISIQSGDANILNLRSIDNRTLLYQGLSTTEIQWD